MYFKGDTLIFLFFKSILRLYFSVYFSDNLKYIVQTYRVDYYSTVIIIQSLGNPLLGHQLPRREWVVLNRLRTGHGRCTELLHKWKMADLPDCDCRHPSQTIHHIIKDCPLRAFKGSMRELHHATDEAINWIKALDIIL